MRTGLDELEASNAELEGHVIELQSRLVDRTAAMHDAEAASEKLRRKSEDHEAVLQSQLATAIETESKTVLLLRDKSQETGRLRAVIQELRGQVDALRLELDVRSITSNPEQHTTAADEAEVSGADGSHRGLEHAATANASEATEAAEAAEAARDDEAVLAELRAGHVVTYNIELAGMISEAAEAAATARDRERELEEKCLSLKAAVETAARSAETADAVAKRSQAAADETLELMVKLQADFDVVTNERDTLTGQLYSASAALQRASDEAAAANTKLNCVSIEADDSLEAMEAVGQRSQEAATETLALMVTLQADFDAVSSERDTLREQLYTASADLRRTHDLAAEATANAEQRDAAAHAAEAVGQRSQEAATEMLALMATLQADFETVTNERDTLKDRLCTASAELQQASDAALSAQTQLTEVMAARDADSATSDAGSSKSARTQSPSTEALNDAMKDRVRICELELKVESLRTELEAAKKATASPTLVPADGRPEFAGRLPRHIALEFSKLRTRLSTKDNELHDLTLSKRSVEGELALTTQLMTHYTKDVARLKAMVKSQLGTNDNMREIHRVLQTENIALRQQCGWDRDSIAGAMAEKV